MLLQHATEYYKTLFGPAPNPGNINVDPSLWDGSENGTEEENYTLTQAFSEEEITNALFSMKKNKAPGPDAFPIEFF